MKSVQDVFFTYAAEFEKTFADDNWERLRPYFAQDAVYEVVGGPFPCRIVGCDNIFAGMKKSLDGFDRALDTREIAVRGEPSVDGDTIGLRWTVTYTRGASPPGELMGRSEAVVRDGVIVELRDFYDDGDMDGFGDWMGQYAPDIDGAYV